MNKKKKIDSSRIILIAGIVLTIALGGTIIFIALTKTNQTTTPLASIPSPQAPPIPAQIPIKPAKPAKPAKKLIEQTPSYVQPKPSKADNEFVIQGLLSTGGEPWTANMIIVKILWLKNTKPNQFLLGQETSIVQSTKNGFTYRIRLQPPSSKFLNWNGGVEGNIGRVIAFLDHKRDRQLTQNKDKIIAVSKELIRYRTGRYDKNILNEVQQKNIMLGGKGYVIVRNIQNGEDQADWKVVSNTSPARLDLNAEETSLPNMYNTFMKLQ